MKLDNLKVQELNEQEMKSIEGGSWIGDALRWVKDNVIISVKDSVVGLITSIGIAFRF